MLVALFFQTRFETVTANETKYEKTIFQNSFASFYLYKELKESARLNSKARIIFSGGEGARGIPGMISKPMFKNAKHLENYITGDFKEEGGYNPMDAIGVSKYINALSSKLLVWINP